MANDISLVDYLSSLGHHPQKIRGNNYWYLSPLRKERTASFKVDQKLNLWYDHGTGKGGTLVDFGMAYFKCSTKELLQQLKKGIQPLKNQQSGMSFDLRNTSEKSDEKLKVISIQELTNPALKQYLLDRQIPLAIASQFCKEVCFEIHSREQLAIGFKNDKGGYELRNQNFKGSSSPKVPTLIVGEDSKNIAVFEGFFDFLSFQTLRCSPARLELHLPKLQPDMLVLNSLSFFEKSRERMERYSNIDLFLDTDKAGIELTKKALTWSIKYKDCSQFYARHKDLNDFLRNMQAPPIKQRHKRGMHF